MSDDLLAFLASSTRPRILVLGDVILDRYCWCTVNRISPEAPIPLLRVQRDEHRLGGAGSVASMLAELDSDISFATVVGTDDDGRVVTDLLQELGIEPSGQRRVADRPTTVKQRFLGLAQSRHAQQMIRVDREEDGPISDEDREALYGWIEAELPRVNLVLVSDYNKGACAGDLVPRVVQAARRQGVKVVADPIRDGDYRRYLGCTCITPNRLEASLATGMEIRTPADGLAAARKLLEFDLEAAIVTLDRDGMAWASRDGRQQHFPVRQRQVYDITGAGDMVLSVIGLALAAGIDYPQAIELANIAGGLEVERLGVVPLSRGEIAAELRRSGGAEASKLMSLDELLPRLAQRRASGQKIVMTNGCYDLLHPGHLLSLQAARKTGDCLVVGLNSDASIRALKGPSRPIVPEQGRAVLLAALECVDYVVLFDDPSVEPLVRRIRPDVLVKAAQYGPEQVVGHEVVRSYGGEVRLTPMQPGYSTSSLIERILSSSRDSS